MTQVSNEELARIEREWRTGQATIPNNILWMAERAAQNEGKILEIKPSDRADYSEVILTEG